MISRTYIHTKIDNKILRSITHDIGRNHELIRMTGNYNCCMNNTTDVWNLTPPVNIALIPQQHVIHQATSKYQSRYNRLDIDNHKSIMLLQPACLSYDDIISCLLKPSPSTRVLFTMSYINIVLNIIPTLYEGYLVLVHRIVMENRPVDPGSIQGSHRPISFIRIKHRTRANDIL